MKLSFIYTNTPDLKNLYKYAIYTKHFEFPDEALELPHIESTLWAISETVSQLTQACLHVSCRELGWKERLVTEMGSDPYGFHFTVRVAAVVFGRRKPRKRRPQYRTLKILFPIPLECRRLFPAAKKAPNLPHEAAMWKYYDNNGSFGDACTPFHTLRDLILPLLNAEELTAEMVELNATEWEYVGFHPRWFDNGFNQLTERRRKNEERARKKQEREAAKRAKQEEAKQKRKGQVYFIQQGEDGPIKIGYSTTPEKRLQSLNTASPYPLYLRAVIEGGKKLEQELHERFAAYKMDGEWFSPHEELLQFIAGLRS